MAITFNAAGQTSTFADLFTDTSTSTSWYRLWTGSADGETGNYVDTSAFSDLGDGWIKKDHLSVLKADFAQADDTDLWVQTWNDAKGNSSWTHAPMDFNEIRGVGVTTLVTGDTPLDQLFANANVGRGTWYRIWIEDTDGSGTGGYLSTPEGNGWIKPAEEGGSLAKIIFPAADPGHSKDIWVRTWTNIQQFSDWEKWTVTTEGTPEPDTPDEDTTPVGTIEPIPEAVSEEIASEDTVSEEPTSEEPTSEDTVSEDTNTEDSTEDTGTQTSDMDLNWTDTVAGSYVRLSASNIITGESIDQFALTTGLSQMIETDTQVTDESPLGTPDALSYFTGNYDAQSTVFISAGDEAAQDILVVYDTDFEEGQAQYDMIVLTGVSDLADANGDGIFTII